MWKMIKSIFTKEFWITPFPEYYAPECFDCNKGNCKKCEYEEYCK
jgi:hypothetical protein